jgi:hypothetical protein
MVQRSISRCCLAPYDRQANLTATPRELATILAALLYYRSKLAVETDHIDEHLDSALDIASGDGQFNRLGPGEIDALCAELQAVERRAAR